MEMFVFPEQEALANNDSSMWDTSEVEYSRKSTEHSIDEKEGSPMPPYDSQRPVTPTNNTACSVRLPRRFSNLVSKTYHNEHSDTVAKDECPSTSEFRTLNRYQIEYAPNKGDLSITPPTTPKEQSEAFASWKQQHCSPSSKHARASPAYRARQSFGSPYSLNDPITPPSTSFSSGLSPTTLLATPVFSHNFTDDDKSSSLRRMSRCSIPGNKIGHRRSLSYVSNCSAEEDYANAIGAANSERESLVSIANANYTHTSDKEPKSDSELSVGQIEHGVITAVRRPTVVYLVDNPIQNSIDLNDISVGTGNSRP